MESFFINKLSGLKSPILAPLEVSMDPFLHRQKEKQQQRKVRLIQEVLQTYLPPKTNLVMILLKTIAFNDSFVVLPYKVEGDDGLEVYHYRRPQEQENFVAYSPFFANEEKCYFTVKDYLQVQVHEKSDDMEGKKCFFDFISYEPSRSVEKGPREPEVPF